MITQIFPKLFSLVHNGMWRGSKNEEREILADVFLVSYPRSGNTWMRFLIANLYNEIENHFDEIDFFNIHEIVPEIGKASIFKFGNFPKIVKTHQEYDKKFNSVILILRSPYDALYSYYKYLNREKTLNLSLSEVIHHDKFGIQASIKHANSYISNCNNLQIVTYEQLQSDPFKYFKNTTLYLGMDCTDQNIINAINKSSFKSMRKLEEIKGRKYGARDVFFTRSGKVGEGFSRIDLGDRKYISESMKKCPLMTSIYA